MRLVRKFRRNKEDYGYLRALEKSASYALRPIFQRVAYRIYGMDVRGTAVPEPDGDRFAFECLTVSDEDGIRQVESMAEWLEGNLRARLEAGSICMVAMDGGQVAAFNLVTRGLVALPVVNLRWVFGPDQAWSEHIATNPGYRRLGLATRVRHRVIATLKTRGVAWFYGGTLRDHPGTLKLARRVGFVELGDLCYRRILTAQSWAMKRFVDEDCRRIAPPFDGIDHLSADELSLQQTARRP